MRAAAFGLALVLAGCGGNGEAQSNRSPDEYSVIETDPVTLNAADGVQIFGMHTLAVGKARAMVLLFHQAGSSKDEYSPAIAHRLAEAGYSSLAIDQRSGGDMYGSNETVEALGKSADYVPAKQDLEAALAWAREQKLPVILWGSSYSASLAFLVAAEHQDQVAALLAFSPDEYFDHKPDVHTAAAKLTIPVFVTSAQDPGEIAAAKSLLDAVPGETKVQFMPTHGGVHGSSILRADRNAKGAGEAWAAALAFLNRVAG